MIERTKNARRRRLGLAAVLVAAAGISTGALVVRAHRAASSATEHLTPATKNAAMNAAARTASRLGETITYEASFATEVTLSLDRILSGDATVRGIAPTQTLRARLDGAIVERAIDATATTSVLAMPEATFTMGGQRLPAVEDALKRGVVVQREKDGRIARVRLPKEADPTTKAVLRSLVDAFEWSSSPSGANTWSAEDPSSEGKVAARYELSLASAERARFVRHVDRIVQPGKHAPGPALATNASAELKGEIDVSAQRVFSISGSETVTQTNAAGARAATAVTALTVTRSALTTNVADALGASASLEDTFGAWVALDDRSGDIASIDDAAKARALDGRTVTRLLADLHSGDKARMGEAQALLVTLLELHPELAAQVARDAARGSADDAATRAELSALASAGSPQAQRGLADVVRAWKDRADATTAIILFSALHEPTNESVDFLKSMQKQNPDAAYIATIDTTLGNMALQLKESDPARADAIAQQFEDRLKGATDSSKILPALAALGNTGSERILEVASGFVTSDDPNVRRMAAYALGRVTDDDAHATLERLAKEDPDARVRAQATRALTRSQG